MQNSKDLRHKVVVDIVTAERLGTVCDIDVDVKTGRINAIILPPKGILRGVLLRHPERVIPWSAVRAVGEEFILVSSQDFAEIVNLM